MFGRPADARHAERDICLSGGDWNLFLFSLDTADRGPPEPSQTLLLVFVAELPVHTPQGVIFPKLLSQSSGRLEIEAVNLEIS
jgi:hypothetical protein